MSTYIDRVLITLDYTIPKKEAILKFMIDSGAEGAIICREYHGGTVVENDRRSKLPISDPAHLSQDKRYHLCLVAFGKFHKRNLTNRGRIWAQKTFDNPKQHWSTAYAHQKEKGGRIYYTPFPFQDMVKYVTQSSDKKDVDDQPLLYLKNNSTPTVEDIQDAYDNQLSVFEKLKIMKQQKDTKSDTIEFIYSETPEREGWKYKCFLDYYNSIIIDPVFDQCLPEGIKLYEWQKYVVQFMLSPREDTGYNGIWLNQASGSGKSTILKCLYDINPKNVYVLPIRPTGHYDVNSLISYNDEPIIVIDDIQASIMNGDTLWKRSVLELLKRITENFPISMFFGGQYHLKQIKARILITSNFSMPSQEDQSGMDPFRRRYLNLNTKCVEVMKFKKDQGPTPVQQDTF